jgi:hypothetical protein
MTMTTPIALSEVPEDIGRNDPCPCGSGNKYKKCCFRLHQVEREASKQARSPHQLIGSKTIPWKVYKILTQIHENNSLALYHELMHDAGPLRQKYPDVAQFLQAVDGGQDQLIAGPAYDLKHFRLDAPDVYLLLVRGADDPKVDTVWFDVVTLRPNEFDADGQARTVEHQGFRLWDVQRHTFKKADLQTTDLRFADLGVSWRKSA